MAPPAGRVSSGPSPASSGRRVTPGSSRSPRRCCSYGSEIKARGHRRRDLRQREGQTRRDRTRHPEGEQGRRRRGQRPHAPRQAEPAKPAGALPLRGSHRRLQRDARRPELGGADEGGLPLYGLGGEAPGLEEIREGMPVGARVTLRGERMWEFLDRFISIALPRVRAFRGVSPASFDGRGNYAIGLREQIIFPEITYDSIDTTRGLDVAVVTTTESDDEARELLRLLGMPFWQS